MSSNLQQFGNHDFPPMKPEQVIWTSQIICGAMMLGVTAFLIVTLIVPVQPHPQILVSYIGVAFAGAAVVLRFVIPEMMTKTRMKSLSQATSEVIDNSLYGIFQTKMIIGLALIEGACFLNLTGFMIERQWWSLAIVGFLLFLMAMMFPTLQKFEAWAEDVKRDLQNQF